MQCSDGGGGGGGFLNLQNYSYVQKRGGEAGGLIKNPYFPGTTLYLRALEEAI